MATNKNKPKTRRVSIPADAVVWIPGSKLPQALQDEVERQVEDFNSREEEKANEQLTNFCGPKHWNVSEMLYSVIGWLTTRDKPIIMGKDYDAAPVAELMGAIVQENNLPACRPGDDWKKIEVPKNLDHLTNQTMDVKRFSPEKAYGIVRPIVELQPPAVQNRIIAQLITDLEETRLHELEMANNELASASDRAAKINNSMVELEKILKSEAAVVEPLRSIMGKPSANG